MKVNVFSILFCLTLLVIGSCCKNDPPKPPTEFEKLPPATQTGKYTMGCLINGKAFIPPTTNDFSVVYQQGILQLGASTYNPLKSIGFSIDEKNYGPINTTSYPLNKYPDSSAGAYIQIKDTVYCTYTDQNTFSGAVLITKLDRVNFIVSGTFQYSTVTSGCDTLKITEGRFDIKYIP